MADKNYNVNINVNSQSVNQATDAIKQLDQATNTYTKDVTQGVKNVQIVYDSNGKAIDVQTQASKRLTAQSRDLVNAMSQLTLQGKQNTAEFSLLQQKHLQLNDTIEKTKGNSKDLFSTLSILPGPVGQFASSVQSGVEILKVFSNTSLASLKAQFGDLGNIVKTAFGFGGAKPAEKESNAGNTEKETEALKEQNKELENQHENYTNNAAAVKAYSNDIEKVTGDVTKLDNIWKDTLDNEEQQMMANIKALEEKGDLLVNEQGKISILNSEYRNLEQSEKDAIKSGESLAITQGKITTYNDAIGKTGNVVKDVGTAAKTAAEDFNIATFAVGIFEAALAAIGIGVAIAAFVALGKVIKDVWNNLTGFKEETDANKGATESFTESLKSEEDALGREVKAIDEANKMLQTRAKIQGQTESQILDISKKAGEDKLKALIVEQDALQHQQDLFRIASINDHDKFINEMMALDEADQATVKSIQKQTNEQKLKNNQEYNASAIKLTQDIGDQIIANQQETLTIQQQKDAIARATRIKGLENLINLEKESNNTNLDNIKKYMDEKYTLEHFGQETSIKQYTQYLYERNKLLLQLEVEANVRQLQMQSEQQNLILANAKQGSKEYYAAKASLAEVEYKKAIEAARTAEKDQNNKILEADIQYAASKKALEEERKKQVEAFRKLIYGIEIDGIKNQFVRERELRIEKFDEDKKALEDNIDFQQMSAEKQKLVLTDLEKAKVRDINKINDAEKQADIQKEIDHTEIISEIHKNSNKGFFKYYEDQRNLLQEQQDKELANTELTEKQKADIKAKYADKAKELHKTEIGELVGFGMNILGAAGNIFSQMSQVNQMAEQQELSRAQGNAAAQDQIKRKYFEKNKTAQIGETIISTAEAAVEAYKSLVGIPVVGPYLAPAAAAAALYFGYEKVALIQSTKYDGGNSAATQTRVKNYGDGGIIDGPSHASSQGGVRVNAEGGEAIMNKNSVTMFKPLLSMMNQMGGGTSFQKGAAGSANYDNAKPSTQQPSEAPIIKTYVVESELSTMQQRQARLKSLSTL